MREQFLASPPKPPLSFQHQKRTLICFLLLATALVVNHFYHDQFMAWSIQLSISAQKLNMDFVATVASTIAIALALGSIPINAFLSSKKLAAFRMLVGLLLCTWVHSLTKLLYQDTRPSFLSTELREGRHFCEKEYGMPSGHSIFSAYAFFCIANQYKKHYNAKSLAIKVTVYIIICVVGLTVVLSRLYFGVHSFNQLAIGILIGTMVFTLTNFSKAYLEHYVLLPVFKARYLTFDNSLVLGLVMVMLGMVLALLFAFVRSYDTQPELTEFYRSIINCTVVKEDFNAGFSVKVLRDGLAFLFFYGIILGIAINPRKVLTEFSFYFDGNTLNVLLRLGCVLLINLPMALLMLVPVEGAALTILRPLLLYPLFGVLTGRYSLDLIQALGIPLAREDLMESAPRDSNIVHI